MVIALFVLFFGMPLFAFVVAAGKLLSPGPILFRQKRVGKGGEEFDILKFRSMYVGAERSGSQITKLGDTRVTPVGGLLRRTKLDELPQFWNVLRGDMSLVGPRPEVPKYVAAYTPEQRAILSIRPGLTDPASIMYRHEEKVLALQSDPERFYLEHLMPQKLTMSLKYRANMSLANDIRLIWLTALAVLRPGAESGCHSSPSRLA